MAKESNILIVKLMVEPAHMKVFMVDQMRKHLKRGSKSNNVSDEKSSSRKRILLSR